MDVIIAVTKSCHHCSILRKELDEMEIPYKVHYLEEHPEWVDKFGLKGSPNVIVDGELVFRKMPEISEFKDYFSKKRDV